MNTKYKTCILLIEDNPEDKAQIGGFLADSGVKHALFHADSLYEGSNILKSNHIDLVLLDLNLPDSTSFKTLSTYLDRFPQIPVIVITSVNNEIIGNQAIKAGAQDFLVKGQFDSKLFGRSVRYALQRFRVQSELQETLEKLKSYRERIQEVQEIAHFGIWEMDLVSNAMVWSDEVYHIFNFIPQSIQSTLSEYLSFVPLDERPGVESFFEVAARDGKHHEITHRILVEGFNVRYVAIQAKVQVEESTGRIYLLGSIQDISYQKMRKSAVLEKNALSQTPSLEDEIMADLSFQIKTPLSSILNLIFLYENADPDNREAIFKDLKTSANDLSISVNNLMNFSHLVSDSSKTEEEEVNLRDLLEGTRRMITIKAGAASVNLSFDLDDNLPEKLLIDAKKTTQVLYNLLDYAVRNNKKFGHVELRAEERDEALLISIRNPGKDLSRNEILELLQSDKLLFSHLNEGGSQGLKKQIEVAIAAKLINTLGGSFDIQSEYGEGMQFFLSIPVRSSQKNRTMPDGKPEMPVRILLVEDHFLNQMATKKVLASWSEFVAVDIADNGLVALEMFRENDYDLVLMDLQMPVMNGIEAARELRKISDTPIIALTANSSKHEQDICAEVGINDYLAKPFKPQELYSKIVSILTLVANE